MRIEAIWQADVQQRVFRELVEAFSHPGEVRDLTRHVGDIPAQRAVLATLMDGEVTLADPLGRVAPAEWPLLQAKHGDAESARYVIAQGAQAPDFRPALGTLESPELGATVLIAVDELGHGSLALDLAGPGIEDSRSLRLTGLHRDWLLRRAEWVGDFPLGVDLLLTDARRVVALPRTTRIAAEVSQ